MLNPADIIFVGWDADRNDVAFVTTTDIAGGEVIYFTDSEWNGTEFAPGEQLIEWTVPAGGIEAGRLLTIDMQVFPPDATITAGGSLDGPEVGEVDYISGFGFLSPVNEMLWAFQGTREGDEVTPENFISVIGNNTDGASTTSPDLTGTGLTETTGAIILGGNHDYMVFNGFDALPDPVSAPGAIEAISNPDNWLLEGPGFNFVFDNPTPGFVGINPVDLYDPTQVTTLYFSGENVAFLDDVSSPDNDVTSVIAVSQQPFLPDDVIEIDILNDSIRPDGEFDYNEVIFTAVRVTRDGETYNFVVEDGSKIKESGATNSDSGQAVEQGDTFFITDDDVNSFVAAPVGTTPFSGIPTGQMVFAIDAEFQLFPPTAITREQELTDDMGDPVGTENANFFVGLNLETPIDPFPCFLTGTRIDTQKGPVAIEELRPGMMLRTADHGYQPILWVGYRTVVAHGDLAPIRFPKDSLGNDRALTVSPQHRMLLGGWRAEMLLGEEEVLVPAHVLASHGFGHRVRVGQQLRYWHILLDCHEIIFAEGCATESLDPAWVAKQPAHSPGAAEFHRIFADLELEVVDTKTARPVAKGHEASALIQHGALSVGLHR